MEEESIYNIIPPNPQITPKKPLYRSKYPHNIPPTGSTFAHHTTSRPGISNLSGQFNIGLQAHTQKGMTQTLGHVKGLRKSSPDQYRKKRTGTMGNQDLPPIRNFSYDCAHKKPNVPKVTERPLLGLKSDRNFLVANAVQCILSTPKQSAQKIDWKKKKDFGKTPEYLKSIKQTLADEYKMIQTLQSHNQQKKNILSQEEVNEIREGLKAKWNEVNHEYQKITHVRQIDTVGLRKRKLNLQKELGEIERDIKKLNKGYIVVESD